MLVFIDESGDPGFKLARVSTEVFVAVLVAFQNSDDCNAAVKAIERLASRLRISDEFKFNKSRHEVRDALFLGGRKMRFPHSCDRRKESIELQPSFALGQGGVLFVFCEIDAEFRWRASPRRNRHYRWLGRSHI